MMLAMRKSNKKNYESKNQLYRDFGHENTWILNKKVFGKVITKNFKFGTDLIVKI